MKDFEKICNYDNLYLAHKKARLGKQNKNEVVRFEMLLNENIQRIIHQLKTKTYKIKGYNKFLIYDPKKREIQVLCYADRIVQHSLCDNVIGPYLDIRLIYDNPACRIGKGTHFAMDRLTLFFRDFHKKHGTEGYVLKCDIRKYFNSIDHGVLHQKINSMKLDDDTKWLMRLILDSYEHDNVKVIRKLRQSGKKKLKKKMAAFKRLYGKDEIEFAAIGRSLASYSGHLRHGHTYHLRKRVWGKLVLTKSRRKSNEENNKDYKKENVISDIINRNDNISSTGDAD